MFIINFIRALMTVLFGAKPAISSASSASIATAPVAPTTTGWESVDTAPDYNWIYVQFDSEFECESFVAVYSQYTVIYHRRNQWATVRSSTGRGWTQFTARVDVVEILRNGNREVTAAVLANTSYDANTHAHTRMAGYYVQSYKTNDQISWL
jgi:hypothetical protein